MSHTIQGTNTGEIRINTETGVTMAMPEDANRCQYVRLLDAAGNELVYWEAAEWHDAPEEVMRAIFGAVCAGARETRARLGKPQNQIATTGKVVMHAQRDPDTDEPLFWSNTDGWVSLQSATVFGSDEDIGLPREAWGVVHLPKQ